MTDLDFSKCGDGNNTQVFHEIMETKSMQSFAKVTVGINADRPGEGNRTRTELTFHTDDHDMSVRESRGIVTLAFRGDAERRQLIEGLRWMADRLESI